MKVAGCKNFLVLFRGVERKFSLSVAVRGWSSVNGVSFTGGSEFSVLVDMAVAHGSCKTR